MKAFLFSISLFFVSSVSAQESMHVVPAENQSRWTFGYSLSPEISYRFLSRSKSANDYSTDTQIHLRDSIERVKFGYSGQFFFGYRISKKITIEAGLGYTDFGYSCKPYELTPPNDPEPAFSIGRTNFAYITAPVAININLGRSERCLWFISAGIAPGYRMRYSLNYHVKLHNGSLDAGLYLLEPDRDDVSRFTLYTQISGGFDLKLNSKVSLRIAPEIKINLTDAYSDHHIRGNYFNAGIELGAIYKL